MSIGTSASPDSATLRPTTAPSDPTTAKPTSASPIPTRAASPSTTLSRKPASSWVPYTVEKATSTPRNTFSPPHSITTRLSSVAPPRPAALVSAPRSNSAASGVSADPTAVMIRSAKASLPTNDAMASPSNKSGSRETNM